MFFFVVLSYISHRCACGTPVNVFVGIVRELSGAKRIGCIIPLPFAVKVSWFYIRLYFAAVQVLIIFLTAITRIGYLHLWQGTIQFFMLLEVRNERFDIGRIGM